MNLLTLIHLYSILKMEKDSGRLLGGIMKSKAFLNNKYVIKSYVYYT